MCLLLLLQAYIFRDYWEDIGTIQSFYDANLALTEEVGFADSLKSKLDITDACYESSMPFHSVFWGTHYSKPHTGEMNCCKALET